MQIPTFVLEEGIATVNGKRGVDTNEERLKKDLNYSFSILLVRTSGCWP